MAGAPDESTVMVFDKYRCQTWDAAPAQLVLEKKVACRMIGTTALDRLYHIHCCTIKEITDQRDPIIRVQ